MPQNPRRAVLLETYQVTSPVIWIVSREADVAATK